MIVRARAAGTRLALVNARMSKGSLRNWGRFDETFRFLLDQFDLVRTQDRATLDGLLALGADPARVAQGPNLKAMIAPPRSMPQSWSACAPSCPAPSGPPPRPMQARRNRCWTPTWPPGRRSPACACC